MQSHRKLPLIVLLILSLLIANCFIPCLFHIFMLSIYNASTFHFFLFFYLMVPFLLLLVLFPLQSIWICHMLPLYLLEPHKVYLNVFSIASASHDRDAFIKTTPFHCYLFSWASTSCLASICVSSTFYSVSLLIIIYSSSNWLLNITSVFIIVIFRPTFRFTVWSSLMPHALLLFKNMPLFPSILVIFTYSLLFYWLLIVFHCTLHCFL